MTDIPVTSSSTAVSPDLIQFLALSLYDANPSDLVAQALTNAELFLPGWKPQEGNTELVLMESLALVVADLVFAINRLPGAVFQALLFYGFDITPNDGAPATCTVTFNLAGTIPYTIPAGTPLQLTLPLGSAVFLTDYAVANVAGQSTVTVTATSSTNGSSPNGFPPGTLLQVLSSMWYVDSATLATSPIGGLDPEGLQEYLSRATAVLQGLNATLVLAEQFTTYALSNGAFRAFTQDNFDATTDYTSAGIISTAVMGYNGAFFSGAEKVALQMAMNAVTQANLVVRVVDPSVTYVDVSCEVVPQAGINPVVLENAIVTALQDYLSTDTWPFAPTVRYFKILNVIEQVPGVDYVVSVTKPSADLSLVGFAPLAAAGAITVKVDNLPPLTGVAASETITVAQGNGSISLTGQATTS